MPQDRKGKKIHVGDIVDLPCRVLGIDKNTDFLNVFVETQEPMLGGDTKTKMFLNARQLELVYTLGESALDIDVETALSDSAMLRKGKELP